MNHLDIVDLLSKRTVISDTSCWEYQGTNKDGYGQVTVDGKFYYTHRLAAHAFFGLRLYAPGDIVVCHKCDNQSCWNINHLFISSTAGNNKDMRDKGRAKGKYSDVTHCINGHEFTPYNTYWSRRGLRDKTKRRQCRECRRLNNMKRKGKN